MNMTTEELFVKGSKEKVRYQYNGQVTIEDLWDLPEKAINRIYSELKAQQQLRNEGDLFRKISTEDTMLELKMGIIRYIVEARLKEAQERELAAFKRQEKQKLLAIKAEREDKKLYDPMLTPDEVLDKMITEL